MLLVRCQGREEAQPVGRRGGKRQLRHREGLGDVRRRDTGRADRNRRGDRLHRNAPRACRADGSRAAGARRERRQHLPAGAATAPGGERRLDRARRGSCHGAGVPVPVLAVVEPGAGRPCGGVGGGAVSPCRPRQPPPRCRHDGHAGQPWRHRGVRLVALCVVLRWGGRTGHDHAFRAHPLGERRWPPPLPRGRCGRDHPDPAREVLRGPSTAPLRCRAAGAPILRRQGGRRPRAGSWWHG